MVVKLVGLIVSVEYHHMVDGHFGDRSDDFHIDFLNPIPDMEIFEECFRENPTLAIVRSVDITFPLVVL